MRILGLMIALFSLIAGMSSPAFAKKVKGKLPQGVSLQTDIQFNASTLHGRYQTPAEAFAKVEDEKDLNDLLMPRTHFKDRMAFEAQGSR